jgi:hypothetical protein
MTVEMSAKEMYIELCEDLQRENGELESMELIESLPRNDSNFTLWKAKYSKNQHYVFWAFGIDSSQLKVTLAMTSSLVFQRYPSYSHRYSRWFRALNDIT